MNAFAIIIIIIIIIIIKSPSHQVALSALIKSAMLKMQHIIQYVDHSGEQMYCIISEKKITVSDM